jgi:hypothetical protein
MLASMATPMSDARPKAYSHVHDSELVPVWGLWRRPGRKSERLGTWCGICGFTPNAKAAQLRLEALAAISEAKRLKLDDAAPTKRRPAAKRAKVRPFFTP